MLQDSLTPQVVSGRRTIPDGRSHFYGCGVFVDTTSTGHVKWSHNGSFLVGA